MKTHFVMLFGLLSTAICGQEIKPGSDGGSWEAPYSLPVPKGWTAERFPIPIGFAPQIPYKGVEDIRFAPGWGKAISDEYWSYAFLWYLEGNVKTDPSIIAGDLKAYYTGLIAANGPGIPVEKTTPVITSFKEVGKDKGDLKTFTGIITMTDYIG